MRRRRPRGRARRRAGGTAGGPPQGGGRRGGGGGGCGAGGLSRVSKGGGGRGETWGGRDGRAPRIRVPRGPVVGDDDTEEPLADLVADDAVWIAAKGGIGGRGNARF